MTDPKDWTEADLLRLINDGEEESLTLDYKACDALQKTDGKKREVSKDVSAFANSVGGTIVYGITEDGHKPKDPDDGYDPAEITKEWLEHPKAPATLPSPSAASSTLILRTGRSSASTSMSCSAPAASFWMPRPASTSISSSMPAPPPMPLPSTGLPSVSKSNSASTPSRPTCGRAMTVCWR